MLAYKNNEIEKQMGFNNKTNITCCLPFFPHLDMNAVSGRMTLKNTSLATSSVFSTVLVTRVEAYLMRLKVSYLSFWLYKCSSIKIMEAQIKRRVQKKNCERSKV